ncbi:TetR family transcriptional regulator [Actinopolymorpha singaporensis]|uniref:DNA-binding transcriptional regulator, AcrR family n=1 Tax=Actinopolymorpha singaporensis TaxID=117157 RepID=A0A1H1RLT6_9ACTN|nr:TetR family transcriptional regulator [Actinopolymorpha singaporensis]SDS36675.1 DNA-binding transcriptional regulator, AcrR family [Actinopolymorpha singaporensis]
MSTGGTERPAGLRERKKALTRTTIEDVALRMFTERGYEPVRLDDICSEAAVSLRTFFRYFGAKEDLVFDRLRARLVLARHLLDERPATEFLPESVLFVIEQTAAEYAAEPERELTRLRLVSDTPALQLGLHTVFAGFERCVRDFAATRIGVGAATPRPRLLAATTVSAFRVGLEMWTEGDATAHLPTLVAHNLAILRGDPFATTGPEGGAED